MLSYVNTHKATFKNCENRDVRVTFMSTFGEARKTSLFVMD